ncbi:MAG: 4-alpha-glucanotransferase [Acidilobus sp.]
MRRGSGLLLHITSLPGTPLVGELGPQAHEFLELLRESGQRYWQVLPLSPTSPEHDNSPYSGLSAFAGNPILVSLELLADEGLLTKDELSSLPRSDPSRVDYDGAYVHKYRLLRLAFSRFKATGDYDRFVDGNSWWLEDYALYVALREHFGNRDWGSWPEPLRRRVRSELEAWRSRLRERVELEKFVQFKFFEQWSRLRAHARRLGVQIIGDIPIYVSYDSADVWANPRIFKLGRDLRPLYVSGVPPDYFSKTGQLWNTPVYDWDELRREGYLWWVRRMRHSMSLFDVVRLDHFRGFLAYWEVPAGEKTAVNGRWAKGPGEALFREIMRAAPRLQLIAEDLGYITPDVIELRDKLGIPGTKVLQFAWDGNPNNPYKPHNYTRNFVVYTGTHDNNTIVGWFFHEASPRARAEALRYMGLRDAREINWAFIRLAMMSVADVSIFPVQDVLGLGPEARMNRPGTARGNWLWRLPSMDGLWRAAPRLREMAQAYGRA